MLVLVFMVVRSISRWTNRRSKYKFCGIKSIHHISPAHASISEDINPTLSPEEMIAGTRFGSDSHVDTSCVNKHAYIETIIYGLIVDAILANRLAPTVAILGTFSLRNIQFI